jgi:serine kinase of HPr protein (carbohydrate metabolism regulator)
LAIAELRGVAKCDIARVNRKLAEALEVQGASKTEAEETWVTAKRLRKEIELERYVEEDQSEAAYDRLVCGNSR